MGDFFMNVMSGGATGLLGTALGGVLGFFKDKRDQAHSLLVMKAEAEERNAEFENAERMANIERATAMEQASVDLQKASYTAMQAAVSSDKATYSTGNHPALVWVDFVRGMTRPTLTMVLTILVAGIIFLQLHPAYSVIYAQISETLAGTIDVVEYVWATAVTFWFGDRAVRSARGL